jgi:hypothetical protein
MATYSQFLKDNPDVITAAAQRVASSSTPMEQPAQPQEAPAPAPSAQPVVARNPSQALAQARGQDVQSYQQTAQSFVREGESKAAGATAKATELGKSSEKARRYMDAAEKTHDDNRIRQEKYKQWMDQDLETLRKPPVEPKAWQKAVGVLSGIVAGTATGYFGAAGQGLAMGLNALTDHVMSGVTNQLQAKDEAGKNLAHTEHAIDSLAKDSSDEADIATKLVANHWFASGKELERIAEQAKVPEYRETAKRLALEADMKGRQVLEQGYEQQLAQARAAAAGTAAAKLRERKEAREDAKTAAEINKLNADADKARNGDPSKMNVAPRNRDVVDQALFASADDKSIRDFRDDETTTQVLNAKIEELDNMLRQYGTEGTWGSEEKRKAAAKMKGLALDIQLTLKDKKKLGTWDAGSKEVLADMVGDPNALLTSGDTMREQLAVVKRSSIQQQETAARNLGLSSKLDGPLNFTPDRSPAGLSTRSAGGTPVRGPASGPASSPAPAQRTRMFGPDGAPILVKPELVESFRAHGFSLEPPAQKRPDVTEMSNQEYEAYARNESGY